MYNFHKSVAIVTGGGSGLGRAVCLRLAQDGAQVAVADINMTGAEETVSLIREHGHEAFAVYCDVTKSEIVEQMVQTVVERTGKIDLLVNNTGMAMESRQSPQGLRICDTDEKLWDLSVNLNLKSVFLFPKWFGMAEAEFAMLHLLPVIFLHSVQATVPLKPPSLR